MCRVYGALGLPPVVRIHKPDAHAACMALDGGAAGVVAPYMESLEEVHALRGAVKYRPLKGARASVIGGGGSARAVVVALLSRGARVSLHTRRREQAQAVTESLGPSSAFARMTEHGGSDSVPAIGAWPIPPEWDLLVNCTPLGSPTMRDESPLPGGPFGGTLVYDLTYGVGESRLVREAREAGCRTLDGLPMLVAQAERQYEWWIGRPPQPGVMRDALMRANDPRSVECT